MSSKPVVPSPSSSTASPEAVEPTPSGTDSLDEEPVGSEDPTFAALLSEVARAPSVASEKFLSSGERAGEHQVLDVVGKGAFGVVYRAVHPVLRSHVAIKVLGSMYASDPGVSARFVEEARAIHRIRHPNIVELMGFGELANGQLYYAMELLEGKTLAAHLAERGALEPTLALHVLSQVAEALDAAHAQGILHRDLKPDNVFVVGELGPTCRVKLLDFGIAKVLGEESALRTRSGMLIGTPAYMSPEQCGGEPVDTKSDIYAFGVIAHELLTGTRLFPTGSVREIMAHHMFEEPPRASSVLSSLSPALDAPLLAMLEKDRKKRPATARAAFEALALAVHSNAVPRTNAKLWMAVGALLALIALWGTHHVLTREVSPPVKRAPTQVVTPTAEQPATPVQTTPPPKLEPPVVREPPRDESPREPTKRPPAKRPPTKRDDLEF